MSNNVNKRTFLNLDYVQGEEVTLEFDVLQDCEQVYLDEYDLTGSLMEDFNDSAVATFTFAESIDNPDAWIGTILPVITSSLVPQTYKYEIKMTHKVEGTVDTLFYGTLTLRATRIL